MKTTINNTEVNLVDVLSKVRKSKTGKYTMNIQGERFTFYVLHNDGKHYFFPEETLIGENKYNEGIEVETSVIK